MACPCIANAVDRERRTTAVADRQPSTRQEHHDAPKPSVAGAMAHSAVSSPFSSTNDGSGCSGSRSPACATAIMPDDRSHRDVDGEHRVEAHRRQPARRVASMCVSSACTTPSQLPPPP